MIIHYCSDLHLNRESFNYPDIFGDVLILAGDICPIKQYDDCLKDLLDDITYRYKHILYILGNHEFYYGDINDVSIAKEYMASYKNIHILQNETFLFNDVQFIGGTCWTNFDDLDPKTIMYAPKRINDFNRTTMNNHTLTIYDWLELHDKFVKFIREIDIFTYQNIVITHHSPTKLTSSPMFIKNITNGCYCANMEIYMKDISYWIHGHQHDGLDLELDQCKIRSNSRGYPNEDCFSSFNIKSILI